MPGPQGVEAAISKPEMIGDCMLYARLHMLLLEEEGLMALVTSEFERAAKVLCTMMSILDRFPVLLRDFVPSVQMLAGERRASAVHAASGLGSSEAERLTSLLALQATTHTAWASMALRRPTSPGC